jgi:hypothetical protein
MLQTIFGFYRVEVTGWRKLLDGEFREFCTSPNIIGVFKSKRKAWVRYVACTGECKLNFSQKTRIGKYRHRLKNNIKLNLNEVDYGLD